MTSKVCWNFSFSKHKVSASIDVHGGRGILLIETEFGSRVPPEVKDKFRTLLRNSRVIPSLSHYLRHVPRCPTTMNYQAKHGSASPTPGGREISPRHSTTSIVISTTPCRAETACSTNMPC